MPENQASTLDLLVVRGAWRRPAAAPDRGPAAGGDPRRAARRRRTPPGLAAVRRGPRRLARRGQRRVRAARGGGLARARAARVAAGRAGRRRGARRRRGDVARGRCGGVAGERRRGGDLRRWLGDARGRSGDLRRWLGDARGRSGNLRRRPRRESDGFARFPGAAAGPLRPATRPAGPRALPARRLDPLAQRRRARRPGSPSSTIPRSPGRPNCVRSSRPTGVVCAGPSRAATT